MTIVPPLRAAYAAAFEAYLREPGEEALRAAYELGRDAVGRQLSVLDLAATHHEVLAAALARTEGGEEARALAAAAADFLLESLSAFEMVQRGFRDAREAALLEQRQGAMLRRLSAFLGGASFALGDADSLGELLQLVAEQARELTGADCCLATAALDEWDGAVHVACAADDPARWDGAGGGGVAAPLVGVDGREVGSLRLLDAEGRSFGELETGLLLHLAQMASAALERAQLYARLGGVVRPGA